jgi:hypothetical protein
MAPGTFTVSVTIGDAGGSTATAQGSIAVSAPRGSAPAVVAFARAQFPVNVTSGSAQVVLSRSGDSSAAVSVVVSSPGGSEVAAFQQTVTFAPSATSATVTIPIVNNGQPGQPDLIIPLALSAPSAGGSVGSPASASLVIQDDNPNPPPPPLVRVTSLQLESLTVRTHKKPAKETVLLLQFSGPLNPGAAANPAAYHLLTGKTRKSVTIFNRPVPLASAVYSPSAFTVTLFPANKLNLTNPDQLQISASQINDAEPRPLGSGIVATLSKKGITVSSDRRGRP